MVDEGLRARFKAAYPDVEVQPASPPRAAPMEVEATAPHMRTPFVEGETKLSGSQFAEPAGSAAAFPFEAKPMNVDAEMIS